MSDLNMIKPQNVQGIINKFCLTIGMLPTSYKLSLTYEEQILAIGRYLEETVYPAINNNAEALLELQNLYQELKDYVDNYFEDLNVQEEINNKLDEMTEDGTLQEIITSYLNVKGILAFNTVLDMKNATNIVDGSFVKTYGNLLYNDGKGEFYKIRQLTNQDIIDNVKIIALTNYPTLIAELIPDYYLDRLLNINDYDIIVSKDGTGDYDTISTAVSNATDNSKIYIKNGNYTNEIINCVGKKLYLIGETKEGVKISNTTGQYLTPPLNIGKGYVENVSIYAKNSETPTNNGSYGVHIDNSDEANNNLIFKNCLITSDCNAGVGIGMRPNCYIKFENCQINTNAQYNTATNLNCSGLFVHTSNEETGTTQGLVLNNCLITADTCPAMVMQSCKDVSVNQGQIECVATSFYSNSFKLTEGTIIRNKYENAPSHNIFIKSDSLSNVAQINPSHYTTTGVAIDKFLNDTMQFMIKRKVIAIQKATGTIVRRDLTEILDTKFGDIIQINGWVKESGTGLQIPLGYADGENYFRWYCESNTKFINFVTNLNGEIQLVVKYWVTE